MRPGVPELCLFLACAAGFLACSGDSAPIGLDGSIGDVDAGPRFEPVAVAYQGDAPNWFDAWGSEYNDIFVVGGNARIYHFNGAAWTQAYQAVETTTTATIPLDLRSVWGDAADDVYAVGTRGLILHYLRPDTPPNPDPPPPEWTVETLPAGAKTDLNAVYGANRDAVFAVGQSGLVYRRGPGPAGAWTAMASASMETLNGLWIGGDGSEGVAVGNLGTIVRLAQGAWGRERVDGLTVPLKDVWGRDSGDLRIVGLDGTLLEFSGSSTTGWTQVEGTPLVYLRDLWSISGSTYVVGWNGTVLEVGGGEVFSYFSFTSNRLEGAWGTFEPDPLAPPPLPDEPPAMRPAVYIVGVSGLILKGPFGASP